MFRTLCKTSCVNNQGCRNKWKPSECCHAGCYTSHCCQLYSIHRSHVSVKLQSNSEPHCRAVPLIYLSLFCLCRWNVVVFLQAGSDGCKLAVLGKLFPVMETNRNSTLQVLYFSTTLRYFYFSISNSCYTILLLHYKFQVT